MLNQLFGLHFLFTLIGIMPEQAISLVKLFDGNRRVSYVIVIEMLVTVYPLFISVLSAILVSKAGKIRDWFIPAVMKGEVTLRGRILCYEITSHQVAINAHEFFTIDYTFLTSMITSVLVHATIVIQFQQSFGAGLTLYPDQKALHDTTKVDL
ncbi:unnamed protein product [Orchesella dallaii]|uniref:Uncharacterized protein n=1 Tax=Orchesella dallaii TaxID=48710 RepID=A0ABP1PNG0_9HEXA